MQWHLYKRISETKLELIRDGHGQVLEFDTRNEALDHLLKSDLTHAWAKGNIQILQAQEQETA
jgi:hypothetical protein